jgi:hypothetical protein
MLYCGLFCMGTRISSRLLLKPNYFDGAICSSKGEMLSIGTKGYGLHSR